MAKKTVVNFGPLPVELINRTLGLDEELEPGEAVLTAKAQAHIATDHGEDYDLVMRYMGLVIANPTYIGQSPHHSEAFEMVRRITVEGTSEVILAAVNFTRNSFGNYNIHSAYRITEAKVDKRVQAGHLCNPKKKGP